MTLVFCHWNNSMTLYAPLSFISAILQSLPFQYASSCMQKKQSPKPLTHMQNSVCTELKSTARAAANFLNSKHDAFFLLLATSAFHNLLPFRFFSCWREGKGRKNKIMVTCKPCKLSNMGPWQERRHINTKLANETSSHILSGKKLYLHCEHH